MQLDDAPCSLCHVVSEVAALMRVRAMSKGLSLQVHYVFPVPEHVRTDPLRVKQVLVNLVGNAIKFTEVGEVQMIVRSQDLSGPAPLIGIEVIDTGIGMDSTQMLGLFQQFSQVDGSASRRFGGTGLGLVISRRIARMLGGDITVMSRPGRGSAFTFTFNPGDLTGQRLITSPSEAVAEPGSAEEQSDQPVHGRILLVEDGPDNQRLIAFLLRKAGADVEIAEDGQAALERVAAAALAGNPYQLILMDMQMPRMDGYTATKELRQRGVHAPIVALTAHAMSTDRERCLAAGCTDYLSKPIQRGCLLAMCARHIGGNSRLPQAA
jgi:CheY-like chemotaxis protein